MERAPQDLGTAVNATLEDARARLAPIALAQYGYTIHERNYYAEMWRQMWSDTSCGFPGAGGQSITRAYTVVVSVEGDGPYAVYHDFRFARLVEVPTDRFYKAVERRRLPGAAGDWSEYERGDSGAGRGDEQA